MADPLNMKLETMIPRKLRTLLEPLTEKLVSPALMDLMIAEGLSSDLLYVNRKSEISASESLLLVDMTPLHRLLCVCGHYS